jgi:hypothetical protein
MKIFSFILGILTVISTLLFLYLGNIIDSFNETTLSVILAVVFEISIVLSSMLYIVMFTKEKKYFHTILAAVSLLIFTAHILIIYTTGYQKIFSYGMDAFIATAYTVILSRNYKLFLKK